MFVTVMLLAYFFLSLTAIAEQPKEIVADSVSEFSNVQGANNWYYGYYESPFTSLTFQEMPQYNQERWNVEVGTYWTFLTANTGHPNGKENQIVTSLLSNGPFGDG